jgi:hypothetical protein
VHGIESDAQDKVVEFKDHSERFQTDRGKSRKRPREIPLPEPHYIRIHAAIAGILHMSGSGRFFDELLDKYGDQDGSSAVRSWEEFDRIVQTAEVRKGIHMLRVH